MTTAEITTDGIIIQTYAEAFSELGDGFKGIYGNDINIDQESPDGQRVGLGARQSIDAQSLAVAVYNSLDPELSIGVSFNRVLKLSGLFLRPTTRSQVDVTLAMEFNDTLVAGYTVKDDLDQLWVTVADNIVTTGSNTVTLFAKDYGEVTAEIGTVTEPVTIILGVISVTNPAVAVPGVDEETEPDARVRRNKSLGNPSQSTRAKMFSAIGNIANVTDVEVYENSTTGTVDTIPAHSIWVVVEGGDVEDIAEVMTKNKHDGTGTKGAVTETFEETVTRPNSTTLVLTHTMNFDRPTNVPLTVTVDAAKKQPTDTINVGLIKTEIAKKAYNINEPALASELYGLGYNAGTNFILTDLDIDDGGGPTESQLTNDLDERFTLIEANITVNLI